MPGDAENPSEATRVEGVDSLILVGVEGTGLATIEQRAEHADLVHLHLGADCQHGVVPDPLPQTC